ncbi:MAG: hypothetical protein JWM25_1003 [Thermoleophilia bacterium]|nr:hypothetical protein [Thermoleophilia bacterium]MCZ4496420.1 hypothetical protein [Thermoleophilia bacterium]
MTTFQLLLFLHILATIIWTGGAFVGMLLGLRLRDSGEASVMARFCEAFAQIAGPLFGGSALLVLATGIGMVAMDGAPEFTDLWVSIAMPGWLLTTVLGATVVGMSWSRLGVDLAKPDASLAALGPRISAAVRWTSIDLVLRTALILLMVWRPT